MPLRMISLSSGEKSPYSGTCATFSHITGPRTSGCYLWGHLCVACCGLPWSAGISDHWWCSWFVWVDCYFALCALLIEDCVFRGNIHWSSLYWVLYWMECLLCICKYRYHMFSLWHTLSSFHSSSHFSHITM